MMPITIADVLDRYWHDHGAATRSAPRQAQAIRTLKPALGTLAADALIGADVRAIIAAERARGLKDATIRRRLIVLRAALRHAEREGLIAHARLIPLPPGGPPRDRWLTRAEAARLIRAARRLPRHGRAMTTLILTGLYTGTRRGAMLRLSFARSDYAGWIDLDGGILYRRGTLELQTKKRQPPAPRWTVERMFRAVARAAGLGDEVVIHTLRHTCATWLAQAGVPVWQAAGYLGMTVEMFEQVYGHHHPAYLAQAAAALDRAA